MRFLVTLYSHDSKAARNDRYRCTVHEVDTIALGLGTFDGGFRVTHKKCSLWVCEFYLTTINVNPILLNFLLVELSEYIEGRETQL